MANLKGWWEELTDGIEETPEYQAESFAIKIAMEIGKRIEELNINKIEFARKLGVTNSYVSQILQGINNMTILTICKIAKALGMEPDIDLRKIDYSQNMTDSLFALFGEEESEPNPLYNANDTKLRREEGKFLALAEAS